MEIEISAVTAMTKNITQIAVAMDGWQTMNPPHQPEHSKRRSLEKLLKAYGKSGYKERHATPNEFRPGRGEKMGSAVSKLNAFPVFLFLGVEIPPFR